jgi:mRNA-degrading endonuclease YafQ of YafQ-DinJ toxin-antitoxin module
MFSINVTGDYRAIFYIENNIAVFYKIGRHSELYNK